jgi:NAD+ diphosphatase
MPGLDPTAPHDPAASVFAFAGARMLVHLDPEVHAPRLSEIQSCGAITGGPFEIGRAGDAPVVAVSMSDEVEFAEMSWKGLRELFGLLPEREMDLGARAFQILEWSAAHAFCGRCGSATVYSTTEAARSCPACGAIYFPRITPAVITLVRRGSEILLARGLNFGPRLYSLIAGFVEPGETLEQAVEREICEEVGISVADIRYFGSQSWPFPSQLMVGFTANHAAGEIRINEAEIADARWVSMSEMPPDIDLPSMYSISGRIIHSALAAAGDAPR